MQHYEQIVVFKPDLEEPELEENINKIKEQFKKQEADILELQKWGIKTLAYEIKKYRQGHYILLRFQAAPSAILAIERHYKLSESIIRFITVKLLPQQLEKEKEKKEKEEKQTESSSESGEK